MKITTFTRQEILGYISSLVAEKIESGFAITSTHTSDNFPQFTMEKGEELIKISSLSILEPSTRTHWRREVLNVKVTGSEPLEMKFYEVENSNQSAYTSTLEEIEIVESIQEKRSKVKYAQPSEKELPVRPLLPLIRKLPGFKSVAIKNLRVTRLTGQYAYKVENTTTRNHKILSFQ